jgi:hypothetical protein
MNPSKTIKNMPLDGSEKRFSCWLAFQGTFCWDSSRCNTTKPPVEGGRRKFVKLKVINTTASQCVPRFNYGIETCVNASSRETKREKKILRKRQKKRSQKQTPPQTANIA